MPPPVVTVTLNAVDISADIKGPVGSPALVYGRGANFDGSAEVPGYCRISVINVDRKYNPYNAGSSLAASLKVGKVLHVSAVYSAVTYHLFHGFLSRISQDPLTGFAELHFVDILGVARRREARITVDATRDLRTYRGLLLDALGVAGGDRDMGTGTGELMYPYTGADGEAISELLTEVNTATGSVHYIKGKAASHQYTAIDRSALQSAAVAETWSDADFTQPFAETLGALDYTEEGVINRMTVSATPRSIATEESQVWSTPEIITVTALATRDVYVDFGEPVFTARVTSLSTGSPTITLTADQRGGMIRIVAGASAATVSELAVYGYRLTSFTYETSVSAVEIDATSQTTYGGVLAGEISSELVPSLGHAHGLASWYVYRYKDIRARPPVAMVNRFPSQLQRDIADRVAVTSTVLSTSAANFWVRSFETAISDSGAVWRTDYDLEAAPAIVNIFTVGGTADQGVGGTAILGY